MIVVNMHSDNIVVKCVFCYFLFNILVLTEETNMDKLLAMFSDAWFLFWLIKKEK